MPKIEVIGGVKAEKNIEIDNNIVDISFEDLIDDYDDVDDGKSDPLDVAGESGDNNDLWNAGQQFDELDYAYIDGDAKSDLKGSPNKHPPKLAINKEKDNLVNETSVQKNNNIDKNFTTEVSKQVGENLVLNYNANKEVFHNSSNREKIQKNNRLIPWSEVYRTHEGTSVTDDYHKVKVKRVPPTYVFKKEYIVDDSGNFTCNHCQFSTSKKKYLTAHIRRKHRKITKTYSCPYCPYVAKHQIKYHLITMHKPESELIWFRCDQCDFKSKLKSQLTVHMRVHLDPFQMMDRMSKCDQCPKMYKRLHSLHKHKKFFHEKHKLKKLQCQECTYECNFAPQLSHHMNVYHINTEHLEILQCSKCSYNTKIQLSFKKHTAMAHREKLLQCEKCAYRCSFMEKMRLHMIKHKEKKDDADLKYRCDKCDYKTYRHYSLQVHKLNHLKPEEIQFFYCYHCNFKAKRKDNLKTHIFRHFKQDEVPFPCYICDFTSTKRHLLVKHIEKHSTGMLKLLNEMETEEKVEYTEKGANDTKTEGTKVTKVNLRTSMRLNQKNNQNRNGTSPPTVQKLKEVDNLLDNTLEDVKTTKLEVTSHT